MPWPARVGPRFAAGGGSGELRGGGSGELLTLLRAAGSLCVAVKCWMQPGRAPEVAEAAQLHLAWLRERTRASGEWARLSEGIAVRVGSEAVSVQGGEGVPVDRRSDPCRRRPPQRTLQWVTDAIGQGSEIVSVRRLTTGCWHANHAVAVVDRHGLEHRLVLRRWARPGWEVDDPDFTARREAAVLELLARSSVPAPLLVAADPDGAACDVPALLITRLPGGPPGLPPVMDAFLSQLAVALAAIHALDGAAIRGIPGYRRYFDPSRLHPPPWARRPALWERAIGLVDSPPPPGPCAFIHRDYHPENTLWSRGRLTGIVDWTSGSIGPVAVDVGHMRWNLAVDYGLDAAEEFLRRYRSLASSPVDDQPYWDAVTLLDLVGEEVDPDEFPGPFDVERFERYLESVLERTD